MDETQSIDRLAMRGRPEGSPVMHQRWENLLFLHWPFPVDALRPLIPAPLELDTYQGQAWVGVTPFHLEDVRGANLPALPGLSSFHELNLRTYVLHNRTPGIWFFSLDASKLVPAAAARIFFGLPYYRARIRMLRKGEDFSFSMKRTGSEAEFAVSWRPGNRLRDPDQDSLAFFLVERYCAFSVEDTRVFHIRVYHHPWILEEAFVQRGPSSLFEVHGLAEPETEPLAHFSRSLEVEIWPPVQVPEMKPAAKT